MLNLNSDEWLPFLDPARPAAAIDPFGFIDILGSTLRLFTSNLWLITKIVFVVVTPFEIFKATSLRNIDGDWELIATTLLLNAVCKLLIAPALIYAMMKVMHTDAKPSVNEAYRWGLTRLVKLAICAAIAYVLQGLGYMFLIIPGIIIGLALELVYPVAVLENGSPAEVLRRSSELTRGKRLEIFGAVLVLWGLVAIVALPVGFLFGATDLWPLTVAGAIVKDVLDQAATVLSLVIYLSLVQKCIPPKSLVQTQPASSY